ncbi:phosphatase PAP2 family protein [Helicobacter aurati]|uniref:Phosphatase PAP2 family protein n=1 Tax=Helicobacter aurati TaxID=137778 RepID=A0A3D8J946_9HELI|nr:phosphatase PAP2 family protein [Helicobacter aurati]RDU73810.1 phosphatase PAP2 family protein [Helicobacter aurati]
MRFPITVNEWGVASKMIKLFVVFIGLFFGIDTFSSMHNGFEAYGDVMQFFTAFLALFLILYKEYIATAQLLLSAFIALGVMYVSKMFFVYIAANNQVELARISQRPNQGSFDGFPSGHSTGSFVAAGFICKKYGFKIGIFAIIAAGLVGISRVYADKHTIIQVICGSLLGFFVSYMLTDSKISIKLFSKILKS